MGFEVLAADRVLVLVVLNNECPLHSSDAGVVVVVGVVFVRVVLDCWGPQTRPSPRLRPHAPEAAVLLVVLHQQSAQHCCPPASSSSAVLLVVLRQQSAQHCCPPASSSAVLLVVLHQQSAQHCSEREDPFGDVGTALGVATGTSFPADRC